MTREAFDEMVRVTRREYPRWRHGQAVFNMAVTCFWDKADPLRASSVDCFHDDRLVPDFLVALTEAGAFSDGDKP
jgi:hypothetical protein